MVWLSPQGSPKEGRAGAVGNKCLIIGLIIIPGGVDKQENKPARRRIGIHERILADACSRKQTNMRQHKLQASGNMSKADVSITATLSFHNKEPTVISHCDVFLQ